MAKTAIEWTDESWNPVAGCEIVSPGCANCYAMRMARRLELMGQPKYRGLTKVVNGNVVWMGKLSFDEKALLAPLSWRTPRRVFVNSMSDLFHEDVPMEQLARIFNVMASSTAACGKNHKHEDDCWTGPPHTFQILTKRAELMEERIKELPGYVGEYFPGNSTISVMMETGNWPLPNVWLGVSVESQKYVSRVDHLLATPAAVRFVSYEPALDHVDFDFPPKRFSPGESSKIDWLIVGGESGPGARPFDIAWARSAIAQCRAAGVACFVKQLGARPTTYKPLVREWLRFKDRAGGDMAEWPAELRVREFPARQMMNAE